ncbi:hypothetical protein [Pedobacter sp. UC225_65]|uniref:hypothetical protein n=1 Tax=Pedobacter sp. UC225_65 TaxID=3350173 RepID=UPI0036707F74
MKNLTTLIFAMFVCMQIATAQQEILLYNGPIPGAKMPPSTYQEESVTGTDGVLRISKVTSPEMMAYIPAKPNGTAVIDLSGWGLWDFSFR